MGTAGATVMPVTLASSCAPRSIMASREPYRLGARQAEGLMAPKPHVVTWPTQAAEVGSDNKHVVCAIQFGDCSCDVRHRGFTPGISDRSDAIVRLPRPNRPRRSSRGQRSQHHRSSRAPFEAAACCPMSCGRSPAGRSSRRAYRKVYPSDLALSFPIPDRRHRGSDILTGKSNSAGPTLAGLSLGVRQALGAAAVAPSKRWRSAVRKQ